MLRALWAALLLLPVAAQDQHAPLRTRTSPLPALPGDSDELKKFLREFEIPDAEFEYKLTKAKDQKGLITYDVTFPSAVTTPYECNNTVQGRLLLPSANEKVPGLVVLHWLGPDFGFLEQLCAQFARKGVATFYLYMPYYGPRQPKDLGKKDILFASSIEDSLAFFRQAVKDIRRAREILRHRPEVDPARVSLFGVSLGAIIGALAFGVDPGFYRFVCVVGGGDLAAIVFNDSRETRDARRHFEDLGYDEAKLREAFRPIDPLTFAGRVRPENARLFNMKQDEIVPKTCTEKLHEAMHRPEIKWYDGRHTWIALYFGTVLKETVEFVSARPGRLFEPVLDETRVRVLLAGETRSLALEVRGPYSIDGEGEPASGDRLDRCTVTLSGGAFKVGDRTFRENKIVVCPARSGDLIVNGARYHGELHLIRQGETFHAVNLVPMERYLEGVVPFEIGPDAPPEAMKAQAVCARTYALNRAELRKEELFDLYADVNDQVYKGILEGKDRHLEAVRATRNEVLTYRGKTIIAYFHSTCGGHTAHVKERFENKEAIPPLAGVRCGWCGPSPHSKWEVAFEESRVRAAFKTRARIVALQVQDRSESGRANTVVATTSDGKQHTLKGYELRAELGLKSTRFKVSCEGGRFVFEGSGWGHGVGMCQYGAIEMARAGKSYTQILSTYYPGTELSNRR